MQDYNGFYKEAKKIFKERIYKDYLRRFCYGVEASCYSYVPQLVVMVQNEAEIIQAYKLSNKYNTPLCFRGAGTSLSGQSSCESILVILDHSWQNITIDKNVHSIRLDCGVIGQNANELLKPFAKKIGPDPATLAAAQIGGIVNNNSSGMCCGVQQNSYNTLQSIRVILNDGCVLDTADILSVETFKKTHATLIEQVLKLRQEILQDEELKQLIEKKYKIKNTTGYSLNSLLDFEDPIDIIAHLFVGSEGTLGFVSSVELQCVKDSPFKACALLFYEDILQAAKAVEVLSTLNDFISSAEIMDYASLKAASKFKGVPKVLMNLTQGTSCILIQSESDDRKNLEKQVKKIKEVLKMCPTCLPFEFSFDEQVYASWWKIRKGLFPIAATSKRAESSVITEDICFEIKDLGKGILQIQKLFKKYGFENNGIIFGHALAGNIHFIITPVLTQKEEFENFSQLVEEMAQKVVKLGGSIKAEHGTGRMIAPFVELEWGKKAYQLHRKIKAIFDPKGLLNPDVIISDDKEIYKKNIKQATLVDEFLNDCVECGFCEKNCPSHKFTLSPRQRIALQREIKRLEGKIDEQSKKLLLELKQGLEYFSIQTCATCSMCEELCPVGIDTAQIALRYKHNTQGKISKKIANFTSSNFSKTLNIAKASLTFSHFVGAEKMHKSSFWLHKQFKSFPVFLKNTPKASVFQFKNKNFGFDESVLYFTSCLNRVFRPSGFAYDMRTLQEVFESLCKKAKINVIYPKQITSMCCGKAFSDFHHSKEKLFMQNKEFFEQMNFKIVLDHGACSAEMKKVFQDEKFEIYDLSEYLLEVLAPRLRFSKSDENVGIYTMCASKKLGLEDTMLKLAKLCTRGEIFKDQMACCGFSGYKGFFIPELSKNATQNFTNFYRKTTLKRGFSNSSTCEIGLSEQSGFSWQHIAYFLDQQSSSKDE
ncbi:FAD-binding and (Fe-S)-binding domain-containing protein [Campylobacter sp. MIT 21-1685]|uniref:FAD-binding and (Fe-S)-binding domain-containing protein n=1 Tax=unclassified Campylobacter TaxID=2593542 RepID=UPI00224ADB15|nr:MULTISPECIES: FAD-binding and (Fe-S)-binding domain-containing protein [unclassified Campylobacter]MCX2682963.1 FAD-binding and (Fe-S)-binding domain-containing protein [Campylobacter sp. MIT 21-1684]MCX2751245.1 FAD-binding and (Fe-S)-binding domain-containing protein [Campylobacter sp. MIT 21-1682]MCX2807444.1 FAD-binding and (Fe-S)-binding domain-containing protein [Campylobacter sp. MIT 21-1685]